MNLVRIKRTDDEMIKNMAVHYSKPKGFVGRNICYAIIHQDVCYGTIAGGSATRFLPGRNEFLGIDESKLNNVVNNIFYHVERVNGRYPFRWFTVKVIEMYRYQVELDWLESYGDKIVGHETLVELPRTGECYKRDGWSLVGQTKGFTCKRVAGNGTDSWSGRRVWNTTDLKPKLVFARLCTP